MPLLLLVLADRIGRGVAGAMLGSAHRLRRRRRWPGRVPLLVASGGPQAYLAALGSQAGEDFAGVEMLYLNPDAAAGRVRAAAHLRLAVGQRAAGRRWSWCWRRSALVLLLAGERRTLAAVAAITVPYLVFHLAFQDTTFARYALPMVWPVAFLAAVALDAAGRVGALAAVGHRRAGV